MEISKHYDASTVEGKWYAYWLSKNYFRSVPDEREPFTIVIPPPNVTGVLHMGHLLNNTIQDILIRRARMMGKNACWVPGTDHASIATEAKVVKMLRERGIKKSELTRTEFLKYAFEWKDKYGGIILEQLKLLGASCDWERERFTMEPKLSEAVLKSFVDLHKKGLIYRGKRITNWDPEAKTVLSNEEVIYTEEQSKLYFIKYKMVDSEAFITVATVRPETIMGDTAICVHPSDERYKHLIGKKCIVPLINREIPIISDNYIDPEFGTGCLKVTPAHDQNDYEIGQRFNLEVIDVLNEDGTISEAGQILVGVDRFQARKQIIPMLEAAGGLEKIEDYKNKVGRSERTNAVIEPRLSLQWFVSMKPLAEKALAAVEEGDIQFYPDNFRNLYRNWMENIRDWCISRQLWWGQQIPAWYAPDGRLAVCLTIEEATIELNEKPENLKQDEDVVDTWFSSWLWPISVFDGFENTKELDYYYPTNVLVTGWDIIFFWVARMVMAGYEWTGKRPFKDVYFTGMVRDKMRRKMSKSLGNSPDAIELIKTYGADGVRFGLLSSSPAGGDLIFDAPFNKETKETENTSMLCEQGRNFCNKLWNALRLIKGWEVKEASQPIENQLAIEWLNEKYKLVSAQVNQNLETYSLSEAVKTLYSFIWDDFCSWYLEWVKPAYGDAIDRKSLEATVQLFEKLMTLLHPFMPFVTEEVWHGLRERQAGEDCVVSHWPTNQASDKALLDDIENLQATIIGVREIRNSNQLKPKELLDLYVSNAEGSIGRLEGREGYLKALEKLGFVAYKGTEPQPAEGQAFIVGTDKYFAAFAKAENAVLDKAKVLKDIEAAKGFLASVDAKLNNERFVSSAPTAVLEAERKKQNDGRIRLQLLEESLAKLS